jgi:hypothetical protein
MKSESTVKAFGGFLELEIGLRKAPYHENAMALSHGRACLAYILDHASPRVVHVPFYTCGAIIDPIEEREIEVVYYAVDDALDPIALPAKIAEDELIIYINYFGLKSATMERLTSIYGTKLVADNCMSFFSRQYGDSYTYNSCRKFFGVPDGAYLYTPKLATEKFKRYDRYCYDHLISRLLGDMKDCYGQFRENEDAFGCNIYAMSTFTERLMGSIDYVSIAEIRRSNFIYVHNRLSKYNRLHLPLDGNAVPHYYPLLVAHAPDRSLMAKDKLFIPTLWPDMLTRTQYGFDHELEMVRNLLSVPIDQRYTTDDLDQIICILKKYCIPASV